MPDVVRELSQTIWPRNEKVRWPVDFVLTGGIWYRQVSEEERSCGKEHKS